MKHEYHNMDAAAELVTVVRSSEASDFYRTIWGGTTDFFSLPRLEPRHLVSTPLPHRRYAVEGKTLTKIVKRHGTPFLVEWDLENLKKEAYGISCERPLVLLSDAHEAIEKSLWFYEHNVLPLVGENNNLPVTAYAASWYNIDAMVTDTAMLMSFLPLFEKEHAWEQPVALSLLGEYADSSSLKEFTKRFAVVRYVLALPEAGAFAQSCPTSGDTIVFHPLENSLVEVDEELCVTRLLHLPTPIIRYATGIAAEPVAASCDCSLPSFVLR